MMDYIRHKMVIIILYCAITLTYFISGFDNITFSVLCVSAAVANSNLKMALDYSTLKVESKPLFVPDIEEVKNVLANGIKSNFESVKCEVIDCPDLTSKPFNLASPYLCGKSAIVDIGGPPYLLPVVQRNKLYDLKKLPKAINIEPGLVIGAGAGPFPYAGMNCEGVFNLYVKNESVKQETVLGILKGPNVHEYLQKKLPNSETRAALLANVYVSQGLPGKVIKVQAKVRTGEKDFVTSIRTALNEHYKDKAVGLGGGFLIKYGKARQHIMDEFSKVPLHTDEDVNNWLHFFEMEAPLVAYGTLVSTDPGMDLRIQHFHSFGGDDRAGHYHNDVTPKEVEYEGYFNIAETLVRVDRPENTHQVGRD